MTVRSFLKCPLCGKEMRLTSPTFYYDKDLRMVELECEDCCLSIGQHPEWPNEYEEQVKYFVLTKRLLDRVKERGVERV